MGFNNFDKCTKVAISIPFAISYDILPRIDGHGGDDEGGVAEELTVLIAGDEFPLPLGVGPSIAEDDARVVLRHFPADDDHLGAAGSRRTRGGSSMRRICPVCSTARQSLRRRSSLRRARAFGMGGAAR